MMEEKKTKKPVLYFCNPYKQGNTCSKEGCYINGGECELTTKLEWALMPIPADSLPSSDIKVEDEHRGSGY